MHVGARRHIGYFVRDLAHNLFRCFPFSYLFLQVGKGLDEEQGRNVRHEKIVQPYRLVNIETLQRGLIENENGTE